MFSITNTIYSEVVTITPDKARTLLDTQTENQRNVTQRRVQEYARRMEAGEWKLGEPLIIDSNNRLIDGQHRLKAVISYGLPVDFVVLRNMPPSSMDVLDIGFNRNIQNIATIKGLPGFSLLETSAIRKLLSYKERCKPLSPQAIISLYLEHKDGFDFAKRAIVRNQATPKTGIVHAALASAYYYEDLERLAQFGVVFGTGFAEGIEDSAAIALRNRLTRVARLEDEKPSEWVTSLVNISTKAIRLFCDRESRKTFSRQDGKVNYYPLPAFTDISNTDAIKLIKKRLKKDTLDISKFHQ